MKENQRSAIVVFITASSNKEAVLLAEMLVGSQLAACVQILPKIQSIYRWQGKIEREAEHLIIAKSTQENFDMLDREVRELHSYTTPEIVAVPAVAVSTPYFEWLDENVRHKVKKSAAKRN